MIEKVFDSPPSAIKLPNFQKDTEKLRKHLYCKEFNFGHNLSFGGGCGSPLLFRYNKDDNIWFGDYYTEIFEEIN